MMMAMICSNIDFGPMGFDLGASCCYSFKSFESLSSVSCSGGSSRSSLKVGVRRRFRNGFGVQKLLCFCFDGSKRTVYSTKTPESLEVSQGSWPVVEVEDESSSSPISLASVFEVVADDLYALNKNLQNIVGAENPLLMSATEQIFGARGKKMRPALVFLVSRATAQFAGLKELTTEHRRLPEIIEMIHTASLIHDDVIDESDLRRGKETVHQRYGTRVAAVLAGDFMFAQSSWYLANLENLEVLKLISQLFHFDVHEDVRTIADATIKKDSDEKAFEVFENCA